MSLMVTTNGGREHLHQTNLLSRVFEVPGSAVLRKEGSSQSMIVDSVQVRRGPSLTDNRFVISLFDKPPRIYFTLNCPEFLPIDKARRVHLFTIARSSPLLFPG